MILFSFILCFCFASSVTDKAIPDEQTNGLSNGSNKNVDDKIVENHDIKPQNDDIKKKDQGDVSAFNKEMQLLISNMNLMQQIGALKANNEWYGRAKEWYVRAEKVEENLKKDLELCAKVMGIIGIRTRIQDLADLMYPGGKPHELGIISTFKEILTSKNEKFTSRNTVIVFRQRVTNYGISVNDFLDVLKCIFGSLSYKAACKMTNIGPKPPKYDDVIGIKNSYDEFGIQPDELKIKVAQIVLEPLPMSLSTTVASGQPLNTPKQKTKALPPTKHDTNTFKIGTDVAVHYISKKKKPLWRCGKIAGYKPEESCYLVELDDGFQTTCKEEDLFPLPARESS